MAQLRRLVLLCVVVTVNSHIARVSKQVYSRPIRAAEPVKLPFVAALKTVFAERVVVKDEVCVASTHGFQSIPGGGDRRYLFSGSCGFPPLTWHQANTRCGIHNAKLATAGHLPATDADPLLEYIEKNKKKITRSWLGAIKKGSKWEWADKRMLSFYSNMWHPGNPSGDGPCVEVVPEDRRAYLNDRSCEAEIAFVCELNIHK